MNIKCIKVIVSAVLVVGLLCFLGCNRIDNNEDVFPSGHTGTHSAEGTTNQSDSLGVDSLPESIDGTKDNQHESLVESVAGLEESTPETTDNQEMTEATVPPTMPVTGPTTETTEGPTTETTEDPATETTEDPTTETTEDPTTETTEDPATETTKDPATETTEDPTTEATEGSTIEPTQKPNDAVTYEDYLAMNPYEQEAFSKTFPSILDFIEWQRREKDAYEATAETNNVIDGDVNIGDLINNGR